MSGTDLSEAKLYGAKLSEILKLENAKSLNGTNSRGVKGLTKEQLDACKARGAIIDEDTTTSSSQSIVSPPTPSQGKDTQSPSVLPAQMNTPPSSAGRSNASTTQQSNNAQVPSTSSAQESTSPPDSYGSSTTSHPDVES